MSPAQTETAPPAAADVSADLHAGQIPLRRLDDLRWLIPRHGAMRTDAILYVDRPMLDALIADAGGAFDPFRQLVNVASLPGIVGRAIGMPDIHAGYGFPVGGVAAFDPEEGGVISPGGVGYDINCGVRLLRSELKSDEVRPRLAPLMNQIMRDVPAGVGKGYKKFVLSEDEVRDVLVRGMEWALDRGFATEDDLAHTEGGGRLPGADPDEVSDRAIERGRPQLGTVGSGNHFIEIGHVSEVYDEAAADELGMPLGTVCVLIHSGSRGLGYQVCTDYLDLMLEAGDRYGIDLLDEQLACAPLESDEGKRYLAAMAGAANYAFTNRQLMAFRVREAFERVLDRSREDLGLNLVYDVAHNNAKWEEHEVEGRRRQLCVHRKGATRAFPPGHPELATVHHDLGQPVLIPGDMGRYSYVLLGTAQAYEETFGSTCHGAGRRMSRTQAKKRTKGRELRKEFEERGIEVRASSYATIAEEVPEAYKDVAEVVDVVDRAGIGRKVVRLEPLGVLKG